LHANVIIKEFDDATQLDAIKIIDMGLGHSVIIVGFGNCLW
jgi:hypothetical protein